VNAAFPRLYAILDTDFTGALGLAPLAVLEAWLDAGILLVQLRAKALPGGAFLELADQMQERIAAANARLIINDRADVSRMAGAAGVHVGQEDLPPDDVRRVLGPAPVVGLSTHNLDQVERAIVSPVSYVAIGPVYETTTKGSTVDAAVSLDGVRRAASRTLAARLPLVAIGGITISRAREVLDAGASSVAVISDLFAREGELVQRAREFVRALA